MKKLLLVTLMLSTVSTYAQTKKVIIEDYTGVRCGFCPDGNHIIEQLEASHPTNLFAIAIHTGNYTFQQSPLRTPEGDAINSAAKPSGYPAGAVDRKKYGSNSNIAMSRTQWSGAFNTQSGLSAIVSLSIDNVVRNNATDYEFDVNVEFTSAPKSGVPLKLQVYVLEDSIEAKAYSQINNPDDLRQESYLQLYGGNGSTSNPIFLTSAANNYYHNNVLRKAIGGNWGYSDVIPSGGPTLNKTYTKHVTFSSVTGTTPVGWVTKNLKILAFVAYDGSAANDQKEILNAEEYSLKSTFPTSVNNIKARNVEILNAFPNPAKVNDIIQVQYTTAQSTDVSLKVYNLVGQMVAQPMSNSREVKGSHIFQWRPADYNLTPGIYMIEVSTPNGKEVQKINIY